MEGRFSRFHPALLVVAGYEEAGPVERSAERLNRGNESLRADKTGTEGGLEKLLSILRACSYRKPTQVGESRRLRRSRELSLRN